MRTLLTVQKGFDGFEDVSAFWAGGTCTPLRVPLLCAPVLDANACCRATWVTAKLDEDAASEAASSDAMSPESESDAELDMDGASCVAPEVASCRARAATVTSLGSPH